MQKIPIRSFGKFIKNSSVLKEEPNRFFLKKRSISAALPVITSISSTVSILNSARNLKGGKVGREGLIMPTWNQVFLPVNCEILAISWQDLYKDFMLRIVYVKIKEEIR
jgi:hypothetical protein